MIRLIVSSTEQVTEDQWKMFYQTFEVENKELETFLKEGHGVSVVGSEIIEPPKEATE